MVRVKGAEVEESRVTVHITRWDLAKVNVELMYTSRATWIMWLTIAAAFVVTIIWLSKLPSTAWAWLRTTAAGIAFATIVLAIGYVPVFLLVVIGSRVSHGILGDHLLVFGPDGIRESTATHAHLFKWHGLHRVRRTRTSIVIHTSPFHMYMLPKRCFASAEAFDDLWRTIQRLRQSR
jgi:hypothetical protein